MDYSNILLFASALVIRSRQVQQQMHSLGSLMGIAHKVIRVSCDGPSLQDMQTKFEELAVMVT